MSRPPANIWLSTKSQDDRFYHHPRQQLLSDETIHRPERPGNILPRQYVIDASNMLMVYAGGRPFERGECEMKRLLSEIDVETCEGVGE